MSNDKKAPEKFPQKMVLEDGTVFTAYGAVTTNAPPPLKPIGGRPGLTRKPAPITHKPAVPVDWSFWPASRRVKRDEAIALSLDLDPHTLYSSTDGHINPEFCPDNATSILFLKRLNLLAASDSRTNILLSEIASWAVSISLSPIPPKFEEIANAAKSKETRALAVEKVTDAMMARNKPIERVYIIQATATHAPAAPNATEKVGAGDTAKASEETPAERRAALDITTMRGCPRLILECWDDVEKLHGSSADGRQVQKILKRNLEKNDEGPSLKTIQNQLRNLRLKNLIP